MLVCLALRRYLSLPGGKVATKCTAKVDFYGGEGGVDVCLLTENEMKLRWP